MKKYINKLINNKHIKKQSTLLETEEEIMFSKIVGDDEGRRPSFCLRRTKLVVAVTHFGYYCDGKITDYV